MPKYPEAIIKQAEELIERQASAQGHHRKALEQVATRDGGLNPASKRLAVEAAIVSCSFFLEKSKDFNALLEMGDVETSSYYEEVEQILKYLEELL